MCLHRYEHNCFCYSKIKKNRFILLLLHFNSKNYLHLFKVLKKLHQTQRTKQQSKKICGILRRSQRIKYQPKRFHEEFNY